MDNDRAEAEEQDGLEVDPSTTTYAGEEGEPSGDPLKDTQKAFHEKAQEVAALREQMAELKGMVDVLKAGKAPSTSQQDEDPFPELDDDSFWDGIYDDPQKLRGFQKKQLDVVGSTILALRQEISGLKKQMEEVGTAQDSEPELKAQIGKLRQNPTFAGLPAATLKAIAKEMLADKPVPGGPPQGGRRVATRKGKSDYSSEAEAWVAKKIAEAGV